MKTITLLASLSLAATAVSHAAATANNVTLTSTNGLVTVYEITDLSSSAALSSTNISAGDFSVEPLGGDVYYSVDILGDTSLSIVGVAVSFFDSTPASSISATFNPILGNTTATVLGLPSGVYESASWATLSSVPFATAFGSSDNKFIWIAGSAPITATNDFDGSPASLTVGTTHAVRLNGVTSSAFVSLGSGGAILSGSIIPEPSSALLLVAGMCGMAVRRRRI